MKLRVSSGLTGRTSFLVTQCETRLTVGWICHSPAALTSHTLPVTDYMSTRAAQPAQMKYYLPVEVKKNQQILIGGRGHGMYRNYSTRSFPQIRCQRRFKAAEAA